MNKWVYILGGGFTFACFAMGFILGLQEDNVEIGGLLFSLTGMTVISFIVFSGLKRIEASKGN